MSKRAVLIGINAYQDPDVSDLAGCVNDIELVTEVLTTHHGFDERDITRLVDPDNTRARIFAALDDLVDATEDDDVALVYYSGHGSQAPDENGDEADGYDETLVPCDSGRSDEFPVRDIVDDELNSYVMALASRTEHATFVFDSCHSGSVDRAALPRVGEKVTTVRAIIPADDPPEGERRIRPEAAGASGERGATGILERGRYVLIAGCRDDQTSKETMFDGRRHGALTFFLMQAVGSGEDLTVREAFERASAGVKDSVDEQDPVLEGPDERLGAAPFGQAMASGAA